MTLLSVSLLRKQNAEGAAVRKVANYNWLVQEMRSFCMLCCSGSCLCIFPGVTLQARSIRRSAQCSIASSMRISPSFRVELPMRSFAIVSREADRGADIISGMTAESSLRDRISPTSSYVCGRQPGCRSTSMRRRWCRRPDPAMRSDHHHRDRRFLFHKEGVPLSTVNLECDCVQPNLTTAWFTSDGHHQQTHHAGDHSRRAAVSGSGARTMIICGDAYRSIAMSNRATL